MLPSESPEMQLLYESQVENKIVSLVEEYRSSHHDRYFGSNNMWRFLNRKLFESYRINIDTRSFFTKMKKDVIKSVEMYEDQEKAANVLFRLVKNYLPIFDIMPPRSVLVNDILNKDRRALRNRSTRIKTRLNLRESGGLRKDRSKTRASHRGKMEKSTTKTDLKNHPSINEVKVANLEPIEPIEKPSCSVTSCSYSCSSANEENPQESEFARYKLKRMKMMQSQNSNFKKITNSSNNDVNEPVNIPASNNPVSIPSNGPFISSTSKTAAIKPYSSSLIQSASTSYASGVSAYKNDSISLPKTSHPNEVPTPSFLPPSFYQNFNAARSRNSGNPDDTPPEWFQTLFNDYKASEIWKLRELFQMERTFMDIEFRKLNALEKISETLIRKP